MPFKDLTEFFLQVRTGKVPTLEQWNFLEEKTDHFNHLKSKLLIDDLKKFRENEKRKLLMEYKKVKKTRTFKKIVHKGDNVPFVDFYEGFKNIGKEDELPEDFYLIEGEKYIDLFFPKELQDLDRLINHVQNITLSKNRSLASEKTAEPEKKSDSDISNDRKESISPLDKKNTEPKIKLTWMHQPMDLVELIKGLIQAKSFKENQKEVFMQFESIFKIELKEKERLQNLKERTKEPVSFLARVEDCLLRWIQK